MGLPDGPKSFKIGLVVLIQYRLWQTASHPASHVAVAITLNAKASSLKMKQFKIYGYRVLKISSDDADKPARRVLRSVNVTKHCTIRYARYGFLTCYCAIVTLSLRRIVF